MVRQGFLTRNLGHERHEILSEKRLGSELQGLLELLNRH